MAARVAKIRHDDETRKFYVYRIFDGFETVYENYGVSQTAMSGILAVANGPHC